MIIRHPLPLLTKESKPISISKTNTILLLQDLHAPFADVANGLLIKNPAEGLPLSLMSKKLIMRFQILFL